MKPHKELEFLYQEPIKEAKQVFGKHFTCKLETAPHGEQFEIAVIPLEFKSKKYDNVRVSLAQFPAVFMDATMRMGDRNVISIATKSGSVKELWHMVEPIVKQLEMGVTLEDLRSDRKFRKLKIAEIEATDQIGVYVYDGEGQPVKKEK